jgi:hypothetical protein
MALPLVPLLTSALVGAYLLALASPLLAQGQPAPGVAAITQPMTLSEAQVRGFLDAMDDLKALAGTTRSGADLSKPAAFAEALRVSGESETIIRRHGFKDQTDFQRVAYNVATAYGVLRKGGKAAVQRELDASRAKQAQAMEKMRQQLSPEQFRAMQAQAEAGMAQAAAMQDVPDENVRLVGKYGDRMAMLGRR